MASTAASMVSARQLAGEEHLVAQAHGRAASPPARGSPWARRTPRPESGWRWIPRRCRPRAGETAAGRRRRWIWCGSAAGSSDAMRVAACASPGASAGPDPGRQYESTKVRKCESAKVRKCGSAEVRKWGGRGSSARAEAETPPPGSRTLAHLPHKRWGRLNFHELRRACTQLKPRSASAASRDEAYRFPSGGFSRSRRRACRGSDRCPPSPLRRREWVGE